MPWLMNEDAALKNKLLGVLVQDTNAPVGGRPVPVRFRFPETEVADVTYPMIVIEHAGISKSDEREARADHPGLPYSPEGFPALADPTHSSFVTPGLPIPYDIDYHVTTFARKALHDISLTAAMLQEDRLPARFGYLEVPEDGTIRRLDLLGGPEPNDVLDGSGRRVFRKTWTIRVSSELLPTTIYDYTNAIVRTVDLDLSYYGDVYDLQQVASAPTVVESDNLTAALLSH